MLGDGDLAMVDLEVVPISFATNEHCFDDGEEDTSMALWMLGDDNFAMFDFGLESLSFETNKFCSDDGEGDVSVGLQSKHSMFS